MVTHRMYNSGVKQGSKLAPTLFGIYAAIMFYLAFENISAHYSIIVGFSDTTVTYLISGARNQIPRHSPNTYEKPSMQMILSFLPTMVQNYSICYPLLIAICQKNWDSGLTLRTRKTMSVDEQVDFFIDGHMLKNVERFKYLGRYV